MEHKNKFIPLYLISLSANLLRIGYRNKFILLSNKHIR